MQNLFVAKNLKLIGLSFLLLVLGYVFLAQGPVDNPLSKTVAPLILVGVYCLLIPWAIVARGKSEKKSAQQKSGV